MMTKQAEHAAQVKVIEAIGESVEVAIVNGLARLGLGPDDRSKEGLHIEILDEGRRGVLGLGARDARVRITWQPVAPAPSEETPPSPPVEPVETVAETETGTGTTDEAPSVAVGVEEAEDEAEDEGAEVAQIAQGVLKELLEMMGFDSVQIELRRAEPASPDEVAPWVLDIHGPGTDVLVGRRGETLAALQHITRLITGREVGSWVHIVVDVEGFKGRRERSLRRLARRMAEQAIRTGRVVMLEPMPPYERRIVHLALRDHPDVTTESVGAGDRRKVTIIPRS